MVHDREMGGKHGPIVPDLTDAQWDRLVSHGVPVDVAVGDMLFRTGDRWYDLILVESGAVDVVRDALPWVGETHIATLGPRTFVGELGLLNGQRAFLSARATEAGRMHRVDHAALQRLMAEDDELCDLLLRTLWARRDVLRRGPAALSLKIVGTQRSAGATALRRYAERLELAHTWVDADDPATAAHIFEHGFSRDDLPVAIVQGENVRNATPGPGRRAARPRLRERRRQRCRPRRRRRRARRARRGDLRGIRGPSHGAARFDRPGRAVRGDVADRELPRVPVRRERRRPHRAGLAAGVQVRRARVRTMRGRRAAGVGRPAHTDAGRRPARPRPVGRDHHRRVVPHARPRPVERVRGRGHLPRGHVARAPAGHRRPRGDRRRRELSGPGRAVPRRERMPRAAGRARRRPLLADVELSRRPPGRGPARPGAHRAPASPPCTAATPSSR